MKKNRIGQKILLILIIVIIVIILTILAIKIVNKSPKLEESPGIEETPQEEPMIQLPETEYNGMEVRKVQMEYLENNDETIIIMKIQNTTSSKVENEKFDILWIGPDEKILGKLESSIESLEVDEELDLNVILSGDLTETKEVKLIKK